MKIEGIAGLGPEKIRQEIERGAKFVTYQYCVSLLVITFRRSSAVYFIRPGESTVGKWLPFTLLTLFLGWWGFPWGLIYTPIILYRNLRGGKDVTAQLLPYLAPVQVPATMSQEGVWPPPPNFSVTN